MGARRLMPLLPKTKTQAATLKRSYDVDRLETKRLQFLRCSGMHTKAVQSIVEEVAVYDRCRFWWNSLNPFSGIELVIPAFTRGIPEHLESLIAASSEIAVYAALFLTLNLAAVMGGGLSIPGPRYDDRRLRILQFVLCTTACFLTNIFASIILRLSSSALARESDMLVFISKIRYWNWINIGVFSLGSIFGMVYAEAVFLGSWIEGDYVPRVGRGRLPCWQGSCAP